MSKFKLILIISFILLLVAGCGRYPGVVIFPEDVVNVEKQDQTTQNLELILSENIANITLLQNLNLGQKIFNISSPIAPISGNLICLKDADGNIFTQDEIKNVTSLGGDVYEVEIYSGVEYNFSIADGCSIRNGNMAVDGSITPRTFTLSPKDLHADVEWDLTRIICESNGDGVTPSNEKPDLTSLFTTEAVDDGVLFRIENNDYYKNLFYVKDNGDFVLSSFDYEVTGANRIGEYSFTFRKTINGDDKSGVVIRLSANTSNNMYHRVVAIVERDLTDVTEIRCKWMGHETDNYANSLKN